MVYIKTTLHTPPNPHTTTQELYSRSKEISRQCKLTQSLTTILDYHRQLSYTILEFYIILILKFHTEEKSQNSILNYHGHLSQTNLENNLRLNYTSILDNYLRLSLTTISDYLRTLSQTATPDSLRLCYTSILEYLRQLSQTILDNYLGQLS